MAEGKIELTYAATKVGDEEMPGVVRVVNLAYTTDDGVAWYSDDDPESIWIAPWDRIESIRPVS